MQDFLETIEKEIKDSGNIEKSNSFRKLYEGHEIIQYCHMPPDYAEKKFNIFYLSDENHHEYSLQQMINQNLFTPSTPFEKYCTNDICKDARAKIEKPVTSTRMISDLPNILFLMVPKFIRRGYSNDVNLNNGFISIQDVQFEIVGVLDHVGSSNKDGHWLTWAKLDSSWYKCNDDDIEEVNQTATISSNNFVFVCVKNNAPSSPTPYGVAFIENENLASTSLVENVEEKFDTEPAMEIEKVGNEAAAKVIVAHTEPALKIEKPAEAKVICKGCNRKFSNLIQHLNRSKCKKLYDLAQMKIEANEKIKKKKRNYMEIKRRNVSHEEKNIEKDANAASKRRGRSGRGDEEKKADREAASKGMRQGRSRKSDEEKQADKEADSERKKKLRENKDYRKTLAERQAEYRQSNHRKINSTVCGRKRIFIETVRDGPVYGCICCHRTLYKNSVIEIEDIEKFRDNLNEAFNELFEYAICSQTNGGKPDIEKIPSTRGRFYLCTTCKNKLVYGKRPEQSHQNHLEIFDTKDHPELLLTELETSLISKALVFMKIFKKPKSRMAAIKDRCVCVPIDDQTVIDTLNQLPRTPSEACIIPIKLKRKKEYKNVVLSEYIDIEKMHRALETLKNCGHPEYEFYEPTDWNTYAQRCKADDPEGYNILCGEASDDEIENIDDSEETNIKVVEGEGDIENIEIIESSQDKEPVDELEQLELKEEEYLKVDAVAKQQFEYNKNICLANDFPELQVKIQDDPISLAPGEGIG